MRSATHIGILFAACIAAAATQAACYNDLTGAPSDRPYVASLEPDSVVAGGAAFTLTVNGYGFQATDVLSWQGAPRAATFVSSRQLTAQIAASDIARAGMVQVAVYRSGGSYDALWLIVRSPSP
jgi:hypothetical protein